MTLSRPLRDMIDCVTFDSDGYRAPMAVQPVDCEPVRVFTPLDGQRTDINERVLRYAKELGRPFTSLDVSEGMRISLVTANVTLTALVDVDLLRRSRQSSSHAYVYRLTEGET